VYTEFFALNEKPFSITPDPRYLYLSRLHADALAHLIYGISESGGFIQLTGEVGTGKTTLIRSLLEQLPEKTDIALILNPQLSAKEFLQTICGELGSSVSGETSVKSLLDTLNFHLLNAHAKGRRIVLIVDEAQNLSPELLEQVRLLTNLETAQRKLLQIILIGQPELRDILACPEMRQVAQRVTGRYHLQPLSREDTVAYITHRMRVAGCQRQVFTASANRRIYRWSGGIPRLINVIADRALLAAFARETASIDGRLVAKAAAEVFGRPKAPRWRRWVAAGAAASVLALGASAFLPRNENVVVASGAASPAERAEKPVGAEKDAVSTDGATASLTELLRDPGFAADTGAALKDLFSVWNAHYQLEGGSACEQAERQELRCMYERGSISRLRRINRPAILTLTDGQGGSRQVLLRGLGRHEAKIVSDGHSFTVDLTDLTRYWFGESLLLWRPSFREAKPLVPGMRDRDVLWLRDSLAKVQGEATPDPSSALYDPSLEVRVREYQRQHLLTVDGIVGAQTQIALSTDLGTPGTPLLLRD
jgi:general secretion pathway protein A